MKFYEKRERPASTTTIAAAAAAATEGRKQNFNAASFSAEN
jgi:hypothetical protein